MKKFALIAVTALTLTGCTTADLMQIDGGRYFQILQVLDNGFLANRCTESTSSGRCYGPVVYMPKSADDMPYDEKVIHLDNPQIIDTFTYTTVKEKQKTVPIVVNKPRQ